MKKWFLSCLLVLLSTTFLFSEGLDMDVFLRFTYDKVSQPAFEDTLLTSRVGFSFAYDKTIAPYFCPGAKAQVSYFPLGGMLKEKIIMFDISGRLYNSLRLPGLDVQPYLGCTLLLASANDSSNKSVKPEVGIEAIFGVIGFDFAYIFAGDPIIIGAFGTLPKDMIVTGSASAVRIGLSWHLVPRN